MERCAGPSAASPSTASTGGTLELTFTVAVYEVQAAATDAVAAATRRRLLACRCLLSRRVIEDGCVEIEVAFGASFVGVKLGIAEIWMQ